MSEKSLWITSVGENKSSQPILDYIINQGEELKKQTNGKIRGVLTVAGASWNALIDTLSLFVSTIPYQPTHHKDLKDASDLYKKKTYEFLIIDEIHKYELSVFQLTCNDTLPVNLTIDSTIAKEEKIEENKNIYSLDTFKTVFKEIVTSEKVVYVIDRLLKLPDPKPKLPEEKCLPNSDDDTGEK